MSVCILKCKQSQRVKNVMEEQRGTLFNVKAAALHMPANFQTKLKVNVNRVLLPARSELLSETTAKGSDDCS